MLYQPNSPSFGNRIADTSSNGAVFVKSAEIKFSVYTISVNLVFDEKPTCSPDSRKLRSASFIFSNTHSFSKSIERLGKRWKNSSGSQSSPEGRVIPLSNV